MGHVAPASPGVRFQESAMASASKRTETIRDRKRKTRGKARKNKLNAAGTTKSPAELFKVQKA